MRTMAGCGWRIFKKASQTHPTCLGRSALDASVAFHLGLSSRSLPWFKISISRKRRVLQLFFFLYSLSFPPSHHPGTPPSLLSSSTLPSIALLSHFALRVLKDYRQNFITLALRINFAHANSILSLPSPFHELRKTNARGSPHSGTSRFTDCARFSLTPANPPFPSLFQHHSLKILSIDERFLKGVSKVETSFPAL